MSIRITFVVLLTIIIISIPNISSALTNENLSQQIAQLLAQVRFLQTQLQKVNGAQTYNSTVNVAPSNNNYITYQSLNKCKNISLNLTKTLKLGSRSEEVIKLQQFLTNTGDYTYGEITGYYGHFTENAVKGWQSKIGLVTEGSPNTTGYGVVGPRTREAMRSKFSCDKSLKTKEKQRPPAVVDNLVVTPKIGQLPLQVIATFALNSSSCSSFSLDWGDGTKPLEFDAENTSVCTKDIMYKRATHTYNIPGTHRIKFRAGNGTLATAAIVKQVDISVGDTAPSGFSLSPTSGLAPLATSITFPVVGSTCTSYEANWGDGHITKKEATNFSNCSQDSGTQSLTHTYTKAGTYVVWFKTGKAPITKLKVNEQWRIIVQKNTASGASIFITPTSGIAPLTVTLEMLGSGDTCTSYQLDWGDYSSIQSYNASKTDCGSQNFKKTFTHTYISAGNYFIRTKLGNYAKLQNLPINLQNITIKPKPIIPTIINTNTSSCAYPDTQVCGEVTSSCASGYICSNKTYKTYSNRCKLEDAKAKYISNGKCSL